jgi:hypothetical protein
MGLSQSHQAQAPVRNPLKRSSITSSDILAWRRPGLPKSTLGGRPRGVRSVGEVFAHITIANYRIANALIAARAPGATFSFDNHLEGTSCH